MTRTIDLNADMGEGFGAYRIGNDEALLGVVTSANVACGFHGGDPTIMHGLVGLAKAHGVAVGAHPGFDDLWGFGRRPIQMSAQALEYMTAYQIGALAALASYHGLRVRQVKAHGALYNMAAKDAAYADALAKAVKTIDAALIFVGLPGSELEKAADRKGLRFAKEGFCDRLYRDDGSLTPRTEAGAVFSDPAKIARQALQLAAEGEVTTSSGRRLALTIDTLCIHGDEPGSFEAATAVRTALEGAGLTVAPVGAA
jgi:UPF0271 protein